MKLAVVSGPVTAAAVILPADFKNTILNDSKYPKKRENYVLLSNNKPSP
jgi:ribonuclease HII